MRLICLMIRKVFLVASTLSSWLFLDYRFVICICIYMNAHIAHLTTEGNQLMLELLYFQFSQAGKIILHYRDLHTSIVSRFLIWGLILVSTSTCYITSAFNRMCTFVVTSKCIKSVIALLSRITVIFFWMKHWIIKCLLTCRELYQRFWPSVPQIRDSFLSTRIYGNVALCYTVV